MTSLRVACQQQQQKHAIGDYESVNNKDFKHTHTQNVLLASGHRGNKQFQHQQ